MNKINLTTGEIVEEIDRRLKLLLHAENLNKNNSLETTIKIIEDEIQLYKNELENRLNNLPYKHKLQMIVDHFGIEYQTLKLAEEVGELIGQIVRYNGGFTKTNRRITEEYADVCVLMAQIEDYYNLDHNELEQIARSKPDEVIDKYNIKWWATK